MDEVVSLVPTTWSSVSPLFLTLSLQLQLPCSYKVLLTFLLSEGFFIKLCGFTLPNTVILGSKGSISMLKTPKRVNKPW